MDEKLAEIKAWLADNAPPLLQLLNPPATPAEIAAFEARHKLVLSPEARAMYLLHNGEDEKSGGIFGCYRWLRLNAVTEEIKLMGSEGIFPLFYNGGGDLYYVKSHNPAAPDRTLYEWWHEVPEDAAVIADSLEGFLAEFAMRLREGRYAYDPRILAVAKWEEM
ncbi:MAG TPA: SMI1/KNR4 family protein [Elusimicrobiota bacterium]|jgi:cell wall assembly regulator SMI1|nr:SMI1/KNR4 family protein [Elusimicrobiota bacterium]